MELFIKKIWGKISCEENYIGGTEDALLLIDYLGNQTDNKLHLRKILSDLHLDILLKEGFVGNGDVYFMEPVVGLTYFDFATDVVINLSAILLESLKNTVVDMALLDGDRKYSNKFTIFASKEEMLLLINALNRFIVAPQNYELTYPLSERELCKLIADCEEISRCLKEVVENQKD